MRVGMMLASSLMGVSLLGADPLSISIAPRFGFAPLAVRVRVHLDRDPSNRSICLHWDEGFSCQTLDGAQAPVAYEYACLLNEEGEVTFTAEVTRDDQSVERVSTKVTVIPEVP